MYKIIIAAAAVMVILVFLIWRFGPDLRQSAVSGPATLNFWDFWDKESIKLLLDEFEKNNPNIKVIYNKQSPTNYRTRVQAQILANTGPDVFRIHNSWLPMFTGYLSPAPSSIFSLDELKARFYPIVFESFVKDDKIFAAPSDIDGLSLYINEEILRAAGLAVPKTWQEFTDAAVKMTVKDSTGAIKTAGAAMGTTNNVDFWPDILGLLLLQQPGINLSSPSLAGASEVLTFYTGFVVDPRRKVWDTTLPSSTFLFASGNLAFYFAPSYQAQVIKQTNPNLKFKIVSVPQLPGRNISWGSFAGVAVSATSKNQDASWQLAKFLSEKLLERQKQLVDDPIYGAYIVQGPFYKSWYLTSGTADSGINDEMIKLWEGVINSVLSGQLPQNALQNMDLSVKQVLDKYIIEPTPTPK